MVAENIENILKRIAAAGLRAHRNPDEITLIAVAKTFSSQDVKKVLSAGIVDIGENYIQELRQKHEELLVENVRWHFIGHLQSNKVKYIAPWIHCIHSVDTVEVGKEISRQALKCGRTLDVLIEVNTSGEASKFGAVPEKTALLVKQLAVLPNMRVRGLMTIGPFLPDPESSRPSFRMLKTLRQEIEREGMSLPHLSMGMTNDFEIAIEEGATMVRIGTAIFGNRSKQK